MHIRVFALSALVAVAAAPARAAAADGPPPMLRLTTIKATMPSLGVSAHRIQTALWREDYDTVAKEARLIMRHADFSKAERERIAGALQRDYVWFREADAKVYRAALALAEAADKKNAVRMVKALGEMQVGCAGCHTNYRARLRMKP